MSTTDHKPIDGTSEATHGQVLPLDGLKQRRRLERLLLTRAHLAVVAGQQRSHGIDDADESFTLQMATESTIRDEFPEEYEVRFAQWLETDVDAEHPSGVLTADCGICRSIATAHGLNLLPPEAA